MSVFNPYEHGARPVQSNNGNFNPLEHGAKPIQPQKEYSLGNRAASLGKSATAGALGAVPDTAALAYNLPAMGINAAMRSTDTSQPFDDDGVIPQLPQNMGGSFANVTQNKGHDLGEQAPQLPLIPSATHAISEGIDNLSDGYTETSPQDKALNQGVEFAAGVGGGGAIAKGAQALGKTGAATVAGFAGSTNKWHIGGAGAAGSTMSTLEDAGTSTGGAMAGGLAAGAAVNSIPSVGKGIGNIVAKGGVALAGLGKKNLNLDAAKAAQELEITLPKAVASDSKILAYADRFVNHAPFAGNIMKDRYAKIGDKILKELDNAYDSVLPKSKLEGIDQVIRKMYNTAENLLPEGATIAPSNTMGTITEIRKKINAPSQSGDFKKMQTIINDIERSFAPSGIKGMPAEMQQMVNQKENLNNAFADFKTAKGQYYLTKLNNAVKDDIALYGKENPEWHKYFSGADDLYSKKATREDLTKLLASKAESATHGEITVGNLSKVLNTPETRDKLKLLVSDEIFSRMEKLGTVTQAFAKKNKNIINPSGTTVAQTTINWVSSAVGIGGGSPVAAGLGVLAASGIAHLLTDKKSLDLVIKLAEKPTEKAAVAFNVRMKQITGYTPVTLARETAKREEKEENKQGKGVRQKFNDHIETNKKRPKSQALKKLLNNPSVQKGAEILGANPWKQ